MQMSLLISKWTLLCSWGRKLNIAPAKSPLFSSFFRRNMSLKQGEFVGSLDCGTTYDFNLHDLLSNMDEVIVQSDSLSSTNMQI